MGLSKETVQFLDNASGSSFLHVSASNGKNILDKILGNTPYTSIHDKFPKEVGETLPEIEPQIVEPEPKPIPSPIQTSTIPTPEPSKEEESPLTDFMLEIKHDLFNANFENTSYF
jgi:hypothetical protein